MKQTSLGETFSFDNSDIYLFLSLIVCMAPNSFCTIKAFTLKCFPFFSLGSNVLGGTEAGELI